MFTYELRARHSTSALTYAIEIWLLILMKLPNLLQNYSSNENKATTTNYDFNFSFNNFQLALKLLCCVWQGILQALMFQGIFHSAEHLEEGDKEIFRLSTYFHASERKKIKRLGWKI